MANGTNMMIVRVGRGCRSAAVFFPLPSSGRLHPADSIEIDDRVPQPLLYASQRAPRGGGRLWLAHIVTISWQIYGNGGPSSTFFHATELTEQPQCHDSTNARIASMTSLDQRNRGYHLYIIDWHKTAVWLRRTCACAEPPMVSPLILMYKTYPQGLHYADFSILGTTGYKPHDPAPLRLVPCAHTRGANRPMTYLVIHS
jgi:hypothetical protein